MLLISLIGAMVRLVIFNTNFNNISAISWIVSFIGGGNQLNPPTCHIYY